MATPPEERESFDRLRRTSRTRHLVQMQIMGLQLSKFGATAAETIGIDAQIAPLDLKADDLKQRLIAMQANRFQFPGPSGATLTEISNLLKAVESAANAGESANKKLKLTASVLELAARVLA